MRTITGGLLDESHRESSTSSPCSLLTHLTTAVCFPTEHTRQSAAHERITEVDKSSFQLATNLTSSTCGRANSESPVVPAVQLLRLHVEAHREAWNFGTWPLVAGSQQPWSFFATLLLWKVHLRLGEREQHLALHLASLPARPTRGAAGGPGPGHEAKHRDIEGSAIRESNSNPTNSKIDRNQ